MPDNHLRTLLEDASADVPAPNLTATVVAGARRRRHRRHAVGALAATAVLSGAAALGLPMLDDPADRGEGVAAGREQGRIAELAPVDDTFACAHTFVVPPPTFPEQFGTGPDLGVGHYGAARYEILTRSEGKRELQVGDADGKLTARVELRPHNGGDTEWVIDGYERCTGPDGSDVPVDGRFELRGHGRAIPAPPRSFTADAMGEVPTSQVVPVDDRPFYNRIGVVEHRTLYAYETESGVSIADVEAGRVSGAVSWRAGEGPYDFVGPNFIPQDPHPDLVPSSDFAGWAYYSHDDAKLVGHLQDGREVPAETFHGDDWKGVLHVLLVPADELESVTLEADGRTKVFRPD
jgi:hypothetical protein